MKIPIEKGNHQGVRAAPGRRLLLRFQNYNEDCDFDELPQYMEYYKLSEIRLAYNPEDMARDEEE